jgi:hypothetical protein
MFFGNTADGTFAATVDATVPAGLIQLVWVFSAGAIQAYANGIAVTTEVRNGTVPASLYQNAEPVLISSEGLPFPDKIGSPKIYNRALTADEVLQNYQSQRAQYGI